MINLSRLLEIIKITLIRYFIIIVHFINFSQKKVFVHGIHRSGTNFLVYILLLNNINVINKNYFRKNYRLRNRPGFVHYFHKKTFLSNRYNGKKINFKSIENYNKFLGDNNAKHIIIKRDIKSWLKSIKKYAKFNKDWTYTNDDKFYIKEYRKFYSFYEKNKTNKKILFVKMENLTNNKKDFLKIERFLNTKLFFKKTNLYVSLRLKNN